MHRHMSPMRLVKRLQRVNAHSLKLRSNQQLKKVGMKPVDPFRQDDATVTLINVGKLRDDIAFNNRRTGSRDMLPDSLPLEIYKFQPLAINRTTIRPIKIRSQFATTDHKKGAVRGRRSHKLPYQSPVN